MLHQLFGLENRHSGSCGFFLDSVLGAFSIKQMKGDCREFSRYEIANYGRACTKKKIVEVARIRCQGGSQLLVPCSQNYAGRVKNNTERSDKLSVHDVIVMTCPFSLRTQVSSPARATKWIKGMFSGRPH